MVDIPTADQAVALGATAFIRTPERMVAIDLAPLQDELAECGELEQQSLMRNITYWLAIRCKLGYDFVARIVEVSIPKDSIEWKVVEWFVRALHVYTGTYILH